MMSLKSGPPTVGVRRVSVKRSLGPPVPVPFGLTTAGLARVEILICEGMLRGTAELMRSSKRSMPAGDVSEFAETAETAAGSGAGVAEAVGEEDAEGVGGSEGRGEREEREGGAEDHGRRREEGSSLLIGLSKAWEGSRGVGGKGGARGACENFHKFSCRGRVEIESLVVASRLTAGRCCNVRFSSAPWPSRTNPASNRTRRNIG